MGFDHISRKRCIIDYVSLDSWPANNIAGASSGVAFAIPCLPKSQYSR